MRRSHVEIIKSLFPALLFIFLYRVYSFILALIVGIISGILIYSVEFKKNKKFSSMDIMGILGLGVQIIMGLLVKNLKTYFIYPLIENAIFLTICIGLLFTKIDIVSYISRDYNAEDDFDIMQPAYRKLTILWRIYFLIRVCIKVLGIMSWSFEMLFTINWIFGTPISIVLLWYSFYYPNKVYTCLKSSNKQVKAQ